MQAQNGPPQGIHSLSTLLKRLEAATSRLEDIALAQQGAQLIGNIPGPSGPSSAPPAPPAPSAPPAPPAPAPTPVLTPAAAQSDTPAVSAFKEIIDGPLAKYVELSTQLGAEVAQQGKSVASAFKAQLDFVTAAANCKKIATSDPSFMTLLKPTQDALMAITEIKDKNRSSKQFNHLSEVAEGIPALAWVTLDQKPGPFVNDMKDSAQFYANRVVKDHKDTDPKQVEWARSYIKLLDELREYIKAHHTTGLTWNPKGQDVKSYSASAPSGSAPAPPPPPPAGISAPPPPPPAGAPAASSKPKAGDMSSVFADLNKGSDVTRGLKKVDKSEMTHKNPALRGSSVVSDTTASPGGRPTIPRKPESFKKKPPKKELDGNKWMIENFENEREIVIGETEISQTVNIFGCKNSVVQIKGKVNAISIVSCQKTSVLLDSTVSALSITASPSFTVQILGVVPTILVDNTDGGQIYLSKESLGVELITAKTSGLNISLPKEGGEEGDFVERPIPEQMKTVISGGKLRTDIVEHAG